MNTSLRVATYRKRTLGNNATANQVSGFFGSDRAKFEPDRLGIFPRCDLASLERGTIVSCAMRNVSEQVDESGCM